MNVLGIDHPALAAANVDAMADWCQEVLGYKVRDGKPGAVWLLVAADGTCLEVMTQNDDPRPERGNFTPGWSHLALKVSDLDVAMAELDSHSVNWLGDIVDAVGGGRLRSFSDPEGNAWQVVERN